MPHLLEHATSLHLGGIHTTLCMGNMAHSSPWPTPARAAPRLKTTRIVCFLSQQHLRTSLAPWGPGRGGHTGPLSHLITVLLSTHGEELLVQRCKVNKYLCPGNKQGLIFHPTCMLKYSELGPKSINTEDSSGARDLDV